LLIINDGSTDLTIQHILKYTDSRIQLHNLPSNVGITNALNIGINLSSGQYIARMDADDICELNRLQLQMNFLEINKNISMVGTSVDVFEQEYENKNIRSEHHYPTTPDTIMYTLPFYCCIAHPSIMIRTHVLKVRNTYNIITIL
jgi:glycosyltransferase involved in cell wall biosynthesis